MFFDKLTKLNQSISYNLFAFNGYFIIFAYIFSFHIIPQDETSWITVLLFNLAITVLYCSILITYTIEQITGYKLPFAYLKHKTSSIILLFGTIISAIYLILFVSFLVSAFIQSIF